MGFLRLNESKRAAAPELSAKSRYIGDRRRRSTIAAHRQLRLTSPFALQLTSKHRASAASLNEATAAAREHVLTGSEEALGVVERALALELQSRQALRALWS